jgi:hypothetical protein
VFALIGDGNTENGPDSIGGKPETGDRRPGTPIKSGANLVFAQDSGAALIKGQMVGGRCLATVMSPLCGCSL